MSNYRYRCPKEIKDLYLRNPKKAYAKSLDHITRVVLPNIKPGDLVETPDGKWLEKRPDGTLQ